MRLLCAILLSLLGLTLCPRAVRADDIPKGCRQDGPLLACVTSATISPLRSDANVVVVEASLSLQVSNTGKLPISVLAPPGDAAFLPDKGTVIAEWTKYHGIPQCGGPARNCLADKNFLPLRLEQGNIASVTVTMTRNVPLEAAHRMADAESATFSGSIIVVDGDGRLLQLSLSLPVMKLDNGLARNSR
jgi:hypothetical protein